MASSSSSASFYKVNCDNQQTVKNGHCEEPIVTLTSHTADNSRRLFFRCPKYKNRKIRCDFFKWCDEEEEANSYNLVINQPSDDCNELKCVNDALLNKKLELKLENNKLRKENIELKKKLDILNEMSDISRKMNNLMVKTFGS